MFDIGVSFENDWYYQLWKRTSIFHQIYNSFSRKTYVELKMQKCRGSMIIKNQYEDRSENGILIAVSWTITYKYT
jgi:hypothetical protein